MVDLLGGKGCVRRLAARKRSETDSSTQNRYAAASCQAVGYGPYSLLKCVPEHLRRKMDRKTKPVAGLKPESSA